MASSRAEVGSGAAFEAVSRKTRTIATASPVNGRNVLQAGVATALPTHRSSATATSCYKTWRRKNRSYLRKIAARVKEEDEITVSSVLVQRILENEARQRIALLACLPD